MVTLYPRPSAPAPQRPSHRHSNPRRALTAPSLTASSTVFPTECTNLSHAPTPKDTPVPATAAEPTSQPLPVAEDTLGAQLAPISAATAELSVWPHGPIPASIASAPVNLSGFIFLDAWGQLRVYHWRCATPTDPWDDIVRQLLQRGIPFAWRLPIARLPAPNTPYHPYNWNPPPQDWTHPDHPLAKAHEHALVALFAQPGAHRFLHMGGLAWRLALAYGPPTLVAEALHGPSWLVRDANRGDIAGLPVACSGDRLYPGEEDILVGRLPDGRSIWPPLAVFFGSMAWNGEWLLRNEVWFARRRGLLNSSKMRTFTRAQWTKELRAQLVPVHRRGPTGPGSAGHAQQLLVRNIGALAYGVVDLSSPLDIPRDAIIVGQE